MGVGVSQALLGRWEEASQATGEALELVSCCVCDRRDTRTFADAPLNFEEPNSFDRLG